MRSEDWAGRDGGQGGTRFEPLPGVESKPRPVEVTGPAGDARPIDPDDPELDPATAEAAAGLRALGRFRVFRSSR